MTVSYEEVTARYYGIPSIVQRTPYEVSLANFTVKVNDNHFQRPVAGGVVASGALKNGQTVVTNITNNTVTGLYSIQKVSSFGYNQTFSPSG